MRLFKQAFLLIFLGFGFLSTAAVASVENGLVLMIKGVVTATSQEKINRTLVKGAKVFEGDIITTAPKSFSVIRMMDQTKLTLRPDTTIAIGNFNLEEDKEAACINLIKGGLRTVTGLIGKRKPEAFQLDTPVASIGIRGTDFIIRICEGELCQLDQNEFIEQQLGSLDNDRVAELINETLPEGAYAQCVTGAIAMTQCADQQDSFVLGKCRIRQNTDCYEVELNANQAAYIGPNSQQPESGRGLLFEIPLLLQSDPYFKLSDVDDEQLRLIEFFTEDGSDDQQCTFSRG